MKIELENKRLLACAELIRIDGCGEKNAIDVGTDHGYLAAYLVQQDICKSVHACDINPGPLGFAEKTVRLCGLEDRVHTQLSNGLDIFPEPPAEGCTHIICAGMGGELIADILSRCGWVKNGVGLILQPMTKADELRKWLYAEGFAVEEERACRDGKFIYAIMRVRFGQLQYSCDERYLAAGRITADTDDGRAYLKMRAERLEKAGRGMLASSDVDKRAEGERLAVLAERLRKESEGKFMTTVGDIFDLIDSFAPFSAQQSYDNSGICAGSRMQPVTKILTALDITCDVVREAAAKGCELVISHHPVIFRPLRTLSPDDPAVMLAASGISAICAHTSFDSAVGGMNDLLAEKLRLTVLEPLAFEEGKPIGYVCELSDELSASELASFCKQRLGCRVVRYTNTDNRIAKVGICSGSGGDLLVSALAKGCGALITGDVKHSCFIDAQNRGFCLIDAGHFYTENIFHEALAERIKAVHPELSVIRSEALTDPVFVI